VKSQPSNATINDHTPDQIRETLQSAVNEFNDAFKAWTEATGCVANLGWNYRDGKALELIDIQFQLFKKPLNKPVGEVTMDRTV
jgi:hypothetical protein